MNVSFLLYNSSILPNSSLFVFVHCRFALSLFHRHLCSHPCFLLAFQSLSRHGYSVHNFSRHSIPHLLLIEVLKNTSRQYQAGHLGIIWERPITIRLPDPSLAALRHPAVAVPAPQLRAVLVRVALLPSSIHWREGCQSDAGSGTLSTTHERALEPRTNLCP